MKQAILMPQGFSTEGERALDLERYRRFRYLIYQAKDALAYPDQSGFFVRTAGMTSDFEIWTGGNKEYGMSDAFIHGETAVVSAIKDFTASPIEAIAWYKEHVESPTDFARPCGNCRDILKKYCDPKTALLTGNENTFIYTRLSDFLFEDFRKLNMDHVNTSHVAKALNALHSGTDVYLPDRLKPQRYGVVLISEAGGYWLGKHYTNVGYDSTTPLLSAVIGWQNSYPNGQVSENHLTANRVVIVSETGLPDVFYRDRQAILELDEILRRHKNREPMRIDLVHAKKDEKGNLIIYQAKRTNAEEWLPYPFSPGAFRMDDVMDAQLGKLIGKN